MSMWEVPFVVVTFLAWFSAPPATLGDVSRREALRRQLTAPSAHVYTNADAPPPRTPAEPPAVVVAAEEPPATVQPKPAVVPPAPPADRATAAAEKHGEAWWRDRIGKARAAVLSDREVAEALQSRINALTNDAINRDDPAQKAKLFQDRQKAIDELELQKKKIDADLRAIDEILEDAKKQDVPVGWIR
jgi:hypothetical protein